MDKASYDVIVIGGGAAGMMAAGRAAEMLRENGASGRVLLIEKNKTLGKKLLITGGGRSNITNAEFDTRAFLSKFKGSDKFLFSAFSQLAPEQTLKFFNDRGMETKVENEKRAFPVSNSAQSVWNVLHEYMKQGNVEVLSDSPVTSLVVAKDGDSNGNDKRIEAVELTNGRRINGKSFILATGGKSHPETGSTGDGFDWLKKLGHVVIDSNSALVPVAMKDEWVKKLQGLALTDIRLKIVGGDKKQVSTGKILFTHFGLSGPALLNLSRDVHEQLQYGNDKEVVVSLDLFPTKSPGDIEAKLQEVFKIESNKKIKNALSSLVPVRLQETLVTLAEINPETFCHSITREERLRLGRVFKDMPMHVSHLLGPKKAIVTSGGVSLEEIDFKTMRSRLYSNLYCIGDILNIDRPSGGYSLQLCWTTGYIAGDDAGKTLSL